MAPRAVIKSGFRSHLSYAAVARGIPRPRPCDGHRLLVCERPLTLLTLGVVPLLAATWTQVEPSRAARLGVGALGGVRAAHLLGESTSQELETYWGLVHPCEPLHISF